MSDHVRHCPDVGYRFNLIFVPMKLLLFWAPRYFYCRLFMMYLSDLTVILADTPSRGLLHYVLKLKNLFNWSNVIDSLGGRCTTYLWIETSQKRPIKTHNWSLKINIHNNYYDNCWNFFDIKYPLTPYYCVEEGILFLDISKKLLRKSSFY